MSTMSSFRECRMDASARPERGAIPYLRSAISLRAIRTNTARRASTILRVTVPQTLGAPMATETVFPKCLHRIGIAIRDERKAVVCPFCAADEIERLREDVAKHDARARGWRDAEIAANARAEQARRKALEEAAAVCDEQAKEPECPERARYCADAIRALINSVENTARKE